MQRKRSRLLVTSSVMTTLLFGACTPTPPVIFRDTNREDAFSTSNPDAGRPPTDDAGTGMDAGVDDRTPTMPYDGPAEGAVTGLIVDSRSGAPLVGARVSLTGSLVEATTDARGAYTLAIGPGNYVIHFSRDGYLSSHRRLRVDGWERVAINASLLPSGPTTSVDNGTGGTIAVDGTRVTIRPGSLTDSTGTPVPTGMVTVTPIDPTVDLDGAPGDFEGVPTMGMPTPIVSFGMVDIGVQTPSGPGDLAPGTTATISVPVGDMPSDNPDLAEGECMPLWWFDPDRAVWVEEGRACAERDPMTGGLVLVGNVGRPGVWNCDVPVQPVCYTGTVTDCGGMPIPGAEIRLTGGSVTSSTTTRTDFDGNFEVRGAARRGAIVRASVVLGGNTYTTETDFLNGNPATCTPAPSLVFPFRYVSATVAGTGIETRTIRASGERVSSTRSGAARFWDVARGPVPLAITCSGPPTDAFETPPSDLAPMPSSVDVGNPVTLTNDGTTTDLFRTRIFSMLTGYTLGSGSELPVATAFDVNIRGAAGAMPSAAFPRALRMPSSTFTVSSPAPGPRAYDATSIPIRWVPADDGAEVSVVVFSEEDPSTLAYARLVDDGEQTISLASFPTIRGPVTIWVTRTIRRYERLAIGTALQLNGSQRFVFDATIR